MSKISLIAALTPQRVIGNQNTLPWHLPADLQRFRQLTLHKSILMGRKTWTSIGRPLPQRRNIVISRQPDFSAVGCEHYADIDSALAALKTEAEIWVIGGGQIYQQLLPKADFLYLTLVDANINGDAFFPAWDAEEWQEVFRESHPADSKHAYAFEFITLQRKPRP